MNKKLNKNLKKAKENKNDEFYTQLTDIEKELKYYKDQFKDKIVYCNCDDPKISNFFYYFSYNFKQLGLKKLITTCYKNDDLNKFSDHTSKNAIFLEYNGERNDENIPDSKKIIIKKMDGNGDFRSKESEELLKQADIIVTNPPFSLFREYIEQLFKYNKKFLIIGNNNAITYKEVFPLLKNNLMWLGYSSRGMDFKTKTGLKNVNACWFTNLDVKKRKEEIILIKEFNKSEYKEYDNYNAIEVGKVKNIPRDYKGVMGVPITFFDHYNPNQFEIIGFDYEVKQGLLNELIKKDWDGKLDRGYIDGKRIYSRVFIKNKKITK